MAAQPTAATRVGVATGVGFPAILNAGLRLQLVPELEAGATFGSVPLSNENFLVYEGDVSLHLLGARPGPRRPLFLRAGVSYVSDHNSAMESRDTFVPISVGYEWFFDSNFGLSLDGGVMVNLSHQKECFGNQWTCFDFAPPVMPAGHAQLIAYF